MNKPETWTYYQIQGRYWNGPCKTASERVWKNWVSDLPDLETAKRTMANGIAIGLDKETDRKSGFSALRIAKITMTVEVIE